MAGRRVQMLTCGEERTWEPRPRGCEAIFCDASDLRNFIETDSNLEMTCPSEGDQELVGSSQTMCSDGKWDQVDKNPPKCRDRTCRDLTGSVKYGKIQCQSLTLADGISIGGSCTLNCGKGFKPEGEKFSQCLSIGDYDRELGRCVRESPYDKACKTPPFNKNAKFEQDPTCVRIEENGCKIYEFRCVGETKLNRLQCKRGRWTQNAAKFCKV